MKSLRLLKKRLIEAETIFTDNIHQALWLLPDGTMIDGEFDGGMRGQDHRIIECGITKYDRYDGDKFWNEVHLNYGGIRLCPESDVALIRPKQKITDTQKSILAQTSYEIELY